MRTIRGADAEPGDVLHGVRLGRDMWLPELDERVIVIVTLCWPGRFRGRVIGLNHGQNTYTVKVGERQEEPE